MKQLTFVYGKTAKEMCDKVNKMGIEPVAFVTAGNGERTVAYYYAKAEAPKAAKAEAEAEAVKADSPKPAATKAKK